VVIRLAQWKKFVRDNWHLVSVRSAGAKTEAPVAGTGAGADGFVAAEGDGIATAANNAFTADIVSAPGAKTTLESVVSLGALKPEDVSVELYYGIIGDNGEIINGEHIPMQLSGEAEGGAYRYTADLYLANGGEYGYQFRVFPHHPVLADKFELGLVKWAGL
jgi:hypothetical protein